MPDPTDYNPALARLDELLLAPVLPTELVSAAEREALQYLQLVNRRRHFDAVPGDSALDGERV